MTSQAIGYMDSGVGGLTVVKEALRQLPYESVCFIGDQARLPYGPRPAEQVREFSEQLGQFLTAKNIKMFVIACNTATSAALEYLQKTLPIPVIGVISPGSRAAIKATKNHRIGVIATEGTIKSNAYEKAILSKDLQNKVFSLACPKFVPIVESNEYKTKIAKQIVDESMAYFKGTDIDTLILGCTHYPLLKPFIQEAVGPDVKLIDSGAETVSSVSLLLDYFNLANESSQKELPDRYFSTGSADRFKLIAGDWLEMDDLNVTHVPVESLSLK